MRVLTLHDVAVRLGVGSYTAVTLACRKFDIVAGRRVVKTARGQRTERTLTEEQVLDLIEARRLEGLRPKHQNRDAQRWARPGCTYDEPCIRCACEIVHGNARGEQS